MRSHKGERLISHERVSLSVSNLTSDLVKEGEPLETFIQLVPKNRDVNKRIKSFPAMPLSYLEELGVFELHLGVVLEDTIHELLVLSTGINGIEHVVEPLRDYGRVRLTGRFVGESRHLQGQTHA